MNPPLAGKRILVGRAAKQAGSLSNLLRAQGARVVEIPFIEIKPPKSFKPLDRGALQIFLAELASFGLGQLQRGLRIPAALASNGGKIGKLRRPLHLAVRGEDLLDQSRTGARHADDEDRVG